MALPRKGSRKIVVDGVEYRMSLRKILLILVLAVCGLCAAPPPVAFAATPQPGRDMAALLQELYTAPEKFTRIQAMLYSMDLALGESLLATLRERAEKTGDKLERAVARYAIAYTTMNPNDVDAFLDAFLYDGQTVAGMYEARYQLRRGGRELELVYFLRGLAENPRFRQKALIALVADNAHQADFGVAGYDNFGLGSFPEDAIRQGEALHDYSQYYSRQIESFDGKPVTDRFLALLNSPEMASRVALYRIAYKLAFIEFDLCERLAVTLNSGTLPQEETTMLLFSMHDIHFCGSLNLAGELAQEKETRIGQAFFENLNGSVPIMCSLMALDNFVSARGRLVDVIISVRDPATLSESSRNKLEAVLQCDHELIGQDRVAKIRSILGSGYQQWRWYISRVPYRFVYSRAYL